MYSLPRWYTKSESSKVGYISKLFLMKRNSVLPHEVIKLSILINCIYFIVVDIVDHLSNILKSKTSVVVWINRSWISSQIDPW